jgi:Carboxypeptidase regulatory-like domain
MTRTGSLSICFVVASACCVGASPASAQTAAGEITGVVHDQVGAAVPGATITVTETRTNLQRVVVSTRDGVYTAASLAPGEYRLDVELAGFKPMRREGIRLATGEKARIDFDLSVGDIREQVTVVAADAPIMRAETASLGTVVENEQVVQLPLNGRLFIMLAAIAPGVALPPNSVLPRINGGRPRTNEYLFDGVSVLQPEPGQVAYYPVVDAIQEFKIESNSPPAEFGRFNGGVVNLTTKSGSNAVDGNAFEFFRNEDLNARNYFQKSNPVKPEYRRNQYGGMLGGPLFKDRTFFFGDYQGQRQSIGRTVTSTVPTMAERQGVFRQNIYDPATTVGNARQPFPSNTIPKSAMDPVALSLLERYPLPTSTATANNYSRTANEINDQDQAELRLDHKFASGRDQLFGRLTHFRDHAVPVTALPDGSGTIQAGSVAVGPQDTRSWAFASNYQHTFSANLLNEVRIGDTRRTVTRSAVQLSSTAGVALNIPGIPTNGRFPNTMPTFARMATSSSGRRRTPLRTSVPASRRSPIRSPG